MKGYDEIKRIQPGYHVIFYRHRKENLDYQVDPK